MRDAIKELSKIANGEAIVCAACTCCGKRVAVDPQYRHGPSGKLMPDLEIAGCGGCGHVMRQIGNAMRDLTPDEVAKLVADPRWPPMEAYRQKYLESQGMWG